MHQKLPKLKAEPIRLFVDLNAKPHAVHTPDQVSLHFQEKVKRQLDEDVRLEGIERVPRNTTV